MADKAQPAQNQDQAKVLRIGMVREGKVVKEVVTRVGESVTIGDSPRNTFELKSKHLPKSFVLFAAGKNNTYALNFVEKMDGKISVKDAVVGLDELRKKGEAARKGNQWILALDHKNRGKITIDDVTFLFQFVPELLESARQVGGRKDFKPQIIDEEDFIFYGFLGVFSIAAAIMMVFVYNTDPQELMSIDDLPERYVELVLPDQQPKEEAPDAAEAAEEVKKEEKKEDDKPKEEEEARPKRELTAEEKAAMQAARELARQERIKAEVLKVGILGSRGENASAGEVEDVFAEGDALGSKLDDALQNVGSMEVANAGNLGVKDATAGGGRGDAGIGDLASGGGGNAKVGSGPGTKLRAKSDLGAIEAVGGDADQVKAAVAKYSAGIKQCYETRLKEVPTLSGRLVIAVNISGGKVTSVSIDENGTGDKGLESCVTSKVRTWRFDPALPQMDIYLPFVLSSSS